MSSSLVPLGFLAGNFQKEFGEQIEVFGIDVEVDVTLVVFAKVILGSGGIVLKNQHYLGAGENQGLSQ